MNKVSRELVKIAKELQAKPSIDFKAMAKELDDILERLEENLNEFRFSYDRNDLSDLDKAYDRIKDAIKLLEDKEGWDEDPLG